MKAKYWIIGGGILAAAGLGYYRYAKNNFSVTYAGMQVNNVSQDYSMVNLALTFNLKSNEGVAANVTGIQFNIYANGNLVGTGVQSLPIEVPGDGQVVPMVINATLSLNAVAGTALSSLVGMLTGGNGITILIEGAVQAGVALPVISFSTLNYPFNVTDHLSF